MSRQEEIREVVRDLIRAERATGVRYGELDDRWMMEADVDAFLKKLHSQGIVIKVERINNLEGMPVISSASCLKLSNLLGHPVGVIAQVYAEAQLDFLKAGYVVVEPLIEESYVKSE